MEVQFKEKRMQKTCNDEKLLNKEYGKNAKKVGMRLHELKSVNNLSEISTEPPPRRHELIGDRDGQFAVSVKEPFRIIFVPINDPLPRKEDGGLDLTKITKIKIIEIGDYHGK